MERNESAHKDELHADRGGKKNMKDAEDEMRKDERHAR
jgi:hypothetical protein